MAHKITYIYDEEGKVKQANIDLVRGDSFIVALTLESKIDTEEEPYVPEDGDTVTFTLRRNYKGLDNDELLLQKIVDIFESPTLELEPSDTNDLAYGSYKYDMQFDSANGLVDTLLQGVFKLTKEVT